MTLMPGDRSGDRLREAQAARLEQAAARAPLEWGDAEVVRAADELRRRASLQMTVGGSALVVGTLAGELDGRGLLVVGIITLVSAPLFVAAQRRLIPRGSVATAPARFRVMPVARRSPAEWVLALAGVWGLCALLVLAFDLRAAAHVLAIPLAQGPASLVLITLTRRWEHRHGRVLLVRDVDGDDVLYARAVTPRPVAGLPVD